LGTELFQYECLFGDEFAMRLVVREFTVCLQNSSSAHFCNVAVMLQFFAQRWEHNMASQIVASSRNYVGPMMTLAQPGV
jgi:hypothetical protein